VLRAEEGVVATVGFAVWEVEGEAAKARETRTPTRILGQLGGYA
jgi:hypothetical protein